MKPTQAIGIMSGSSLDGLDLCAATFSYEDRWQFQIDAFETIPFPTQIKNELQQARDLNGEKLHRLDIRLGQWIGMAVVDFVAKNKLSPTLIGSHGHTIFHQTNEGLSLQIGNGHAIANASGITTICDFRQQNVLLGGQGAPLVPIGDLYLFEEYDAFINLGGIANITVKKGQEILAGDVVPCNQVLNKLSQKLNEPFDKGGVLASQGKKDDEWYEKLSGIPFFKQEFPKSISNEWVASTFLDHLPDIAPIDGLCTFTHFISDEISRVLSLHKAQKVLVTGGGAFNSYLIRLLEDRSSERRIVVPDDTLVQAKEALVFAFMGLLRVNEQVNCLTSYTGSKKDHSAGVIFLP
jgi:anhydro-N-acetylmuramic acid kinase